MIAERGSAEGGSVERAIIAFGRDFWFVGGLAAELGDRERTDERVARGRLDSTCFLL